jgi:hypothetical protein
MNTRELPPCDSEIFELGKPLLVAYTGACRAAGFEPWVKAVGGELRIPRPRPWEYQNHVHEVLKVSGPILFNSKTEERG